MARSHTVLLISGLDPSGGAGFIADVRVVGVLGLRPIGVVTALTEQDTSGVRAVHPVDGEIVAGQLRGILADIEVDAVKIGMIPTEESALAIADALFLTRAPVVWDPVLRPTSGSVGLFSGDVDTAVQALAPHLTLITPNISEASVLTGEHIPDVKSMEAAAAKLANRLGCAVLVKGGHMSGDESIDVLWQGSSGARLSQSRVEGGSHVHGTGCALSTAIAVGLARGQTLCAASESAKSFVAQRIAAPIRAGRGAASVV